MRVIIVEPMKPPRVAEIGSALRDLQQAVGGSIEMVPAELGDSALVICNEEGKLLGLPGNRFVYDEDGIPYDLIAGTFLICDDRQGELVSITPEHEQKYMERYGREMILSLPEMSHHKPDTER